MIYYITSRLQVFPAQVPDIMEQRPSIPVLYCLNSWLTESVSKINCCLIPLSFRVAYYSEIVARTFLLFFLWGEMLLAISSFKVTTSILRSQLYPEPQEKPTKAGIANIPRVRGSSG